MIANARSGWLFLLLLTGVARAELNFQYNLLDNSFYAYERDVGDIDGDGDNDIVAVQEGHTALEVFRAPMWARSTLISFAGTYRYPRADDFKLADIDGDGDLDMVTRLGIGPADDGLGIAVWCENLGGGSSFTQRQIGTSPSYVKDIVVADFDRDGRLDVAMRMDSQTQLWLQETNGTWTEVLLNHPSHEGMEVGDLDMDGDPDLILNGFWFATPNTPAAARIAANYTNRIIDNIWFNQGGDWTADSCKVVVGDFDADGTNDVAFSQSERAGYSVTWYRSSTPDGAGPWIAHPVTPVDYCHNLQAADFNLDGKVDLLVGGMIQSQHRGLKLMLNTGAGTNWTPFVIQTNGSYSAETGDIDNDGDLDIVGILNWDSAPTWIYRNNAAGPPSLDFWFYHQVSANHVRTFSLCFPDVNGDGNLDIASGPFVYLNPGPPLTGVWPQVALQDNVHAFATTDVDGDNLADLIAQKDNPGAGRIDIYWVEAANAVGTSWTTPVLIGNVPRGNEPEGFQGYAVAQLVPGGPPEIVINSPQGLYYFAIPSSNPGAGNWPRTLIAPNNSEEGIGVADIDGDGDLDISFTAGGVNEVKWARNPGDGSANWPVFVIGTFPEADWPDRCAAADLNGDGRVDIIVTEENSGSAPDALACWWEQPNGGATSATWTRHVITNQYTMNSMDVGDVDQDGDIDVVLAEHRGFKRIAVWANDGLGNFAQHPVGEDNESHLGARLVDLDGDGDFDLVSIAYDTFNQLHLWRNDSPGNAPPIVANVTAINAFTVHVRFSEPVETASAQALNNYAINNGIIITSAILGADSVTVTLTTSLLSAGITNLLTVNFVTDRDTPPHPIAANSQASFTFTPDTIAPMLASVTATNPTTVRVQFGEPVEQFSAQNPAHYAINKGVMVLDALLGADTRTVTLSVASMSGGDYTLTVSDVTDLADPPNPIAPNSQAAFTFNPDPTPPTVTNVTAVDSTTVRVLFSEPVEAASAQTPANYSINNGVAVTWALLGIDTRTVTLITTPLTGGNYTLIVNNVADRAPLPNLIASNSQTVFSFSPPSLGGITLDSATSKVDTDSNNNGSLTSTQGALTSGYILVGVSMYDSATASSITSATFGGTAMTLLGTTQSANAYTEIFLFGLAVGNKPAGNYAVTLTASTGIDQMTLGVAAFSNVRQTASTSTFASSTGWDTAPTLNVSSATGDLVVDILSHDSGTATPGANQTQIWKQEDTTDRTDGVSSRESATGATTTMSYAKSVSAPWSLGAVALKGGGPPPVDNTPPTIAVVATSNANTLRVLFSEPVAAASAQTLANYAINNGVTISAAVLAADSRTVTLSTSTLGGGPHALTVNNIADQASPPNLIAPNSQTNFTFIANEAPVAANDNYSVNEDAILDAGVPGVLGNDTDGDADTLTAALITGPLHGTVMLNNNGSFTFAPAPNYHGPDSFAYRAFDGIANSAPATVTIAVLPVNDAPVVADNAYGVNEAAVLTVSAPGVLANDGDLDGDTLTAVLESGPLHGTLAFNGDGSFTYTLTNNYNGPDSFTYHAFDGDMNSPLATVSIGVLAVNVTPLAAADNFSMNEDDVLHMNAPGLLDNDTDADGDSLTALLQSAPLHGILTLNADGSFIYTPTNNYSGADAFTYRARDGTTNSGAANVSITIAPVNDEPNGTNDAYVVNESAVLNLAAPGVLANDADVDGDPLTSTLATGPSHGTLTLNADGSFSYAPSGNYNGPEAFTYLTGDGTTNSATNTVNITVLPVNEPPVAANDSYSTEEDTVLNIIRPGVLDNDTDGDGDTLTTVIENAPGHGTLTLNADGSFAYTPASNYHGPDSFTYRALDGLTSSSPALVTLTVQPINDTPVATANSYSVNEAGVLQVMSPGVLGNDADADSDTLTAAIESSTLHGTLTFNSDGSFTYSPTDGYSGLDTFTYRALDAFTNSETAVVNINVLPVDLTPPSVVSVTVTNTSAVRVLFSEPLEVTSAETLANYAINNGLTVSNAVLDGDSRTVTLTTSTLFGGDYTLTVNNISDLAAPPNAIAPEAHISFSFVVNVPVAVNDEYSVSEDGALDVSGPGVLGNDTDADGDPLMAELETGPLHGLLTLRGDGSFAYTPAGNYHGSDGFTYRALDGITNSAPAAVAITVLPVNDAPVAANDAFMTAEDTALFVNAAGVLGNDTDAEGGTLTAALVSGPTNGVLTFNTDGSFTYSPASNYAGSDGFAYYALDGATNSNAATVSISVQAVNDVPVAVGDNYSVTQATVLHISAAGVLGNDTDADGNPLTAALETAPLHGTLTLSGDGSFTYTPTNQYIGPDNFTYRALDAATNSVAAIVSITVMPADNTPPTITSLTTSNATTVSILFSEPVETASAQTVANYIVNNDVTVSAAVLEADTRTVTLATSTLLGGNYTLTINNVTDRATPANPILPNSQAAFSFTPPSAAITFSSAASKVETDNNNSASLTFAQSELTNGLIIVGVSMYDPSAGASVTTASYGGTPMALLGTAQSTSAFTEVYLFGLAVGNKPAGNYAVALTASTGINEFAFGVSAFSNVRQTTSTGAFASATGSSTAPTVGVSSTAGDVVVDILSHDSGSTTLGANQTQNWKQEDTTDRTDGVSSREPATGATTTMSYTKSISAPWSIGAVALKSAGPPLPNTPPTLGVIGNRAVNEGAPLTFTAAATDPDAGQTLTFSFDSGAPAGAAINATSGAFTWTPTEAQGPALYSVIVRVTDTAGGTDSETIQITVNEVNAAPVLAAIGNRSANTGAEMTFTVSATDSDVPGQALTFSLDAGAPPGAAINSSSGVFTWTPPQVATNVVTVRVTDGGGGTDFETIQIIATSLPAPWQTADVGSPTTAGSAGDSNGLFSVVGAGNISGAADNFRYVYQVLTADGQITTRVFSSQNTGTSARAGVMIRESLNNNSKHAMMNIAPNGTFRFQRRTSTGGSTSSTTSSSGTFPNTWVRLVRSGNTITAYRSANGSTWTQAGSATITMASNIYVGLGVASGSSGTLNTSVFDNVTVMP